MKPSLLIFGVLISTLLFLTGCGFVSADMFSDDNAEADIPAGMTRVTLDLGGSKAPVSSIITWGDLTVSGGGMDTLTVAADGSAISLTVAAGPMREFALTAATPLADYRGTAVADLEAGTSVSIEIPMQVDRFKILIPDTSYARVSWIDDMTGANKVDSTNLLALASSLELNSDAMVAYVDYDSQETLLAGISTTEPGGIIWRAESPSSSVDDWTAVIATGSIGSLEDFRVRRSDDTIFLVARYGSYLLFPYTYDGTTYSQGTYATLTHSDSLLDNNNLGYIFDFDILDDGSVAVLSQYMNAEQTMVYILSIFTYDAGTDTWSSEITSIDSDGETALKDFDSFTLDGSYPRASLTHNGDTVYVCASYNYGNYLYPRMYGFTYDSAAPSLTYRGYAEYTGGEYVIISPLPSFGDSLVFSAFENNESSCIIKFKSAADFDSTNLSAAEPEILYPAYGTDVDFGF